MLLITTVGILTFMSSIIPCSYVVSASGELSDKTVDPEVIKLFSCLTQQSTKLILLINVDILTFISMMNTTSERLKARNFFICHYFSFY